VLLSAPATFEYYLISDPSLWYDKGVVLSTTAPGAALPRVLIVSTDPKDAAPLNMLANARRLEAMSRERFGADRVKLEIMPGEIHETVFPIALTHALLWFAGKQAAPR
jgi:predicted alpha/beta superfamily hydrolase